MARKPVTIGKVTRASEAALRLNIIQENESKNSLPLTPPIRGCKGNSGVPTKKTATKTSDGIGADELLASIGKLSPSERKQLLARLSLAESGLMGQDRDVDMWSLSVYEALVALADRGGGAGLGPMVVKRLMGATATWAPVEAFMSASKLDGLKVVERQSVYGLLAKLLVKHAAEVADRTGAPFSAKLVSTCVRNIRSVFDDAFPNYVASGLAHVVARRLTAPRVHAH